MRDTSKLRVKKKHSLRITPVLRNFSAFSAFSADLIRPHTSQNREMSKLNLRFCVWGMGQDTNDITAHRRFADPA